MQKERKVSLSQSGLSEEEEISRREAIIQQQHSLPLMYLLLLSLPREEGCGLQAILVKRGCSVPWYCCWSHLDATSYHNLPRARRWGYLCSRSMTLALKQGQPWSSEYHCLPSLWWLLSSPSSKLKLDLLKEALLPEDLLIEALD